MRVNFDLFIPRVKALENEHVPNVKSSRQNYVALVFL